MLTEVNCCYSRGSAEVAIVSVDSGKNNTEVLHEVHCLPTRQINQQSGRRSLFLSPQRRLSVSRRHWIITKHDQLQQFWPKKSPSSIVGWSSNVTLNETVSWPACCCHLISFLPPGMSLRCPPVRWRRWERAWRLANRERKASGIQEGAQELHQTSLFPKQTRGRNTQLSYWARLY